MPIPNTDHPQTYPSLTLDWEAYAAMLEDCDATPEQQRELIEALWSIVVAFVDLGFDVHAPESCGEGFDPLSDVPPDLLHLLAQDQMNQDKEDTW